MKLAIFYHIHQTNHWKELFDNQIIELQQSGLWDAADYIHFGVNGEEPLPYNLTKVNETNRNTNKDLEADTLFSLWQFCKKFPDAKVLYLHTKGVTWDRNVNDPSVLNNIELWRKYLEHFTIRNWRDCVSKLHMYDCVGTEWEDIAYIHDVVRKIPHYAGNMWWANASYIQTLDAKFLYVKNDWPRHQGEFWIGTGNPNYYNYHSTGKNKYFSPTLITEYLTKKQLITQIDSAWTGHYEFAQWLVERKKPETIVDLGVDYAFSTFTFALPNIGTVYGVDLFQGDIHAGNRNTENLVLEMCGQLKLDNVVIINSDFNELAKTWDKPIDILHIDGYHTYDAVKNDYETWSKFVKEDGVILLHDTEVMGEGFGVGKFFSEINIPKTNFKQSSGLGVVSKDARLIEDIKQRFV